jgi:predicted exporter
MPSLQLAQRLTGRAAAILWLLFVFAICCHQWQFWRGPHLATDVLALLPVDEQHPEVTLATRQLAAQLSAQVVVMIGAPDWASTQRAAQAWRAALERSGVPLRASPTLDNAALQSSLDFYQPWRNRLLTPDQRLQLSQASVAELAQTALTRLHQAGARLQPGTWAADPLGLWPQWWASRAGDTQARLRDAQLWLSDAGREWMVLPYTSLGPAFSLSSVATYAQALQTAERAARQVAPDLVILHAGIPLHSEAAAVQASWEINTIGWGSLAAVLLLVWLAFRAWQPLLLVAGSLLIGCAVALSVTAWVFGQVHLLTLVFGASLIGVAEDYGLHYFASRQAHPEIAPRSLMQRLLPGLLLALLTSVMAYAVLGAAPFPGLRQMAVFSAVGLIAAFLTAVCWFPHLDRGPLPPTRFAQVLAHSLNRWPRWQSRRSIAVGAAALLLLCAVGASQLHSNDDIRQLQNSPAALLASQREVGRLLGAASPSQFYLVRADSVDGVLAREERLTAALDAHVRAGHLRGYRAVSDWLPSAQRQAQNAELTAGLEQGVIAQANAALGEQLERPHFSDHPMILESWLAHPASSAARALWLGPLAGQYTSIVMLRGLTDPSVLDALAHTAKGLPGVTWVDKTRTISQLLGRYRVAMTWLLITAHAAVLALLWWRYRSSAWRAWLPTAIASLATIAILACWGHSVQLFNVLALALLLGIGVDYSIFLQEHPEDPSAWLAVVLGAASTWLSLGLLGLSSTPALRAFGLTLLIGIPLVWALAPLCRASCVASAP